MNTKFNSWLWPARPMGKRQVKALQGEHNRLVNSHQQLVEACQSVLNSGNIDKGTHYLVDVDDIAKLEIALAAATANGHLKGVQS